MDTERCCGPAPSADSSAGGDSPDLVCTLGGGEDAVRRRVGEWHAVTERALRREPAVGGVSLVYEPDPDVAAELARLGAAEFACCSFFAFTLTIGPAGTRFTVTAPDAAHDVLAAVFGTVAP